MMDVYSYDRRKTNMRERFSLQDKKIVLSKSNNRCAHCGKPLDTYTVTVEHCVPLSKGGSNDRATNLVALCESCNEKKNNLVVNPNRYYKYLTDLHKEIIQDTYDKYMTQAEWLNINTFFPYDLYIVPNYDRYFRINPKVLRRKGEILDLFRDEYDHALKTGGYTFRKYKFDDYFALIKYNNKKHKKDLKYKEEDFIEELKWVLKNGAVYLLLNGASISGYYFMYYNFAEYKDYITAFITIFSINNIKDSQAMVTNDYINLTLAESLLRNRGLNKILIEYSVESNDPRKRFIDDRSFGVAESNTGISYFQAYKIDEEGELCNTYFKPKEDQEVLEGSKYFETIKQLSGVSKEEYNEIIESLHESYKKHMEEEEYKEGKKSSLMLRRIEKQGD